MEFASKRRALLLLIVAMIFVATASASVMPVSAAPSVSPSPSWNEIVNGDFNQGTSGWSFYKEGNTAGYSWNIYSDSNRGDYPSDDASYLRLQASCYASDWATTVASQSVSIVVEPYLTFYATIRIEAGMQLSNAGVRLKFEYYTPLGGWEDVGWICYDDNYNSGWTYIPPSGTCHTYTISNYGNTWIGVDDGSAPGRSVYNNFNSAYPGYLGTYPVKVTLVECYDYAHGNILAGQTTYAKFDGIRLGDYPPTPSVSISPTTTEYDTSSAAVTYQWSFGDVPTLLCGNGYRLWLRDGIKYQFNAYVNGSLLITYGDVAESSSWKEYPVAISAKGEYTAYMTARVLVDPHAPWISNTYFSEILNGYTLTVNTNWAAGTQGTATLSFYQHGSRTSVPIGCGTTITPVIVDPNSAASISNETYDNGSARTITYSVIKWAVGSSKAQTVNYISQYHASLRSLDEGGNPLSRSLQVVYTGDDGYGNHGTFTASFSSATSRWMDYGSVFKVAKLAAGSSPREQWYCYNGTLDGTWRDLTVSASADYNLVYWHQYRLETELLASQYGAKVCDNASHLMVGDWIRGCAWLWNSDVDARLTQVGTFTFKWILPNGFVIRTDTMSSSSCITPSFQAPQTYGNWALQASWSDGVETVYNATLPFYIYHYDVALGGLEDQSGQYIDMTVQPSIASDSTWVSYNLLIAVTTGTEATSYMKSLNIVYGSGVAEITRLSTSFFTVGSGITWTAHIINLDSLSAHQVAFRVKVYDPMNGYVYMDTLTRRDLGIDGEGDLTLAFTPSSSWWRNGLLRVTYAFYVYDPLGVNLLGFSQQDFGNNDPASWIMKGTGVGDVKAIYYSGVVNSTTLTQIPASLLAYSTTAHIYSAFEDCYALSTENQINSVVMYYVNINYVGGNAFATGCVPASRWVQEGTNIALTLESPFYPKPPYYSSATRFVFLNWCWTQGSRWLSENATTLSLEVAGPVQVVAWWRTQFLVEFTPYVPTTAPTDTVQVSYTANNTVTYVSVRSASTLSVWVDNYTQFTMHDLWVNDYNWYAANYDRPSKTIVGGVSLTLNYVERTNQVSNVVTESNKFEAGGTLQLNVTLTTTYYNAGWINATIMLASSNTVLVDRSGATWSNIRIPLLNNTAMIKVLLPQDIGNGTLILKLTAYDKVEPTTTQTVLTSSVALPPPEGGTGNGGGISLASAMVIIGVTSGIVFVASVSIRAATRRTRRRRGDRGVPVEGERVASEEEVNAGVVRTAPEAMKNGNSVAQAQLLSLVRSVALMELDVEKGVQLKVLRDGDSRFIRFLKRDVTRCGDYFDTASKSYPATLSITRFGDHITFIPYSKRGGTGRARRTKSIFIVSITRELQNSEVKQLKKSMLTKPPDASDEVSNKEDSLR